MKKVYIAEWASKSGRDLPFDLLETAGFDREKTIDDARCAYAHTTKSEQQDRFLTVFEYDYDESVESTHNMNRFGIDEDAVLFDAGGTSVAEFGTSS